MMNDDKVDDLLLWIAENKYSVLWIALFWLSGYAVGRWLPELIFWLMLLL